MANLRQKYAYILRWKPEPGDREAVWERYKSTSQRLHDTFPKHAHGEFTANTLPKHVQSLEDFLQSVPVWKEDPDAYICDVVLRTPIYRVQRGTRDLLCYLLPALVLQHYAVLHGRKKLGLAPDNVGVIDVAPLIRDHFTEKQMRAHLIDDEGGLSTEELQRIMHPRTYRQECIPIQYFTKEGLAEFGPHLLDIISIYKDFYEPKRLSYWDKDSPTPPLFFQDRSTFPERGAHNMLIVGMRRRPGDGQKVLLLQNWWADKQFIEMDEDYLQHRLSSIYYVKNPQTEIPSKFATIFALYAETTFDKKASTNRDGRGMEHIDYTTP